MSEQIELNVNVTGLETLNELTDAKKKLNAALKDTPLDTPLFNKYASQLAVINDKQRDVRIQTKAGHEAYFKAGLELRQLMLATVGTSGAFGHFSSQLSNSVLNAVQLKAMLVPLGISMGGVGIAITAIVSALPAMIELFKKSAQSVEDFTKATEDLTESQLQQRKFLLEQWKGEVIAKRAGASIGGFLGLTRILLNLFGTDDPKEIDAKIKVVEESLVKLSRLRIKAEVESAKLVAGEEAEGSFAAEQSERMRFRRTSIFSKDWRPSGQGANVLFYKSLFKDAEPEADHFTEGLQNNLMQATTVFSDGLRQAFNFGDSLAQQFLSRFAAGLANLLIGYGLSFIPGIGPFLAAGFGYTPGKSGMASSETVSISANRAAGGGTTPFFQVVPIVNNTGLAVLVESGSRTNSRRRR